jgi:TonB-linked SusC/RagA family outer membrane protein
MKKIMNKTIIGCILWVLGFSITAQNSEFSIVGSVYDELSNPLPGVSIYRKDKPGVGTISDIDGRFSIKAKKGDMLVFSYLGYETTEFLVVKSESQLDITLAESTTVLEETVVVGMGTQRKASVVGAITSVQVSELQVPATSINNLLGGRVPGVISLQTSGEPGKNISEFWIRGIGTFGANSSALVLIDGLEGDLSQIDPADVESFSVLKDASATAVYGVRGANGVVLVTTKRGIEDKLNITTRSNITLSHLKRMPQYLGAYEYALLANEASVVRNKGVVYDPITLDLIQYGLDPDLYPDVNWQDEILNRNSWQQTHYINARGGGSIARYFLSMGFSNESAAYKQDKHSKYSANVGYHTYNYRSNIDINLTKTTSVYFGASGYLSQKNEPGNANTDYLWSAQQKLTPLTIPTKYSTGHLPAYGTDDEYSPYVMLNSTGMAINRNLNNKITLAIEQDLAFVTKGLSLRAQGAYTSSNYLKENRSIMPELYYASHRTTTGALALSKKIEKHAANYSLEQDQYYKIHFESTINYQTLINNDHRITGLVYYYMSEEQRLSDVFNYNSTAHGASYKDNASMQAIPLRYQGVSSRATYSYQDTYFVDGNFGYTGSENFQAGRRFGFFPSVAVGWVPSNYYAFKENVSWIDFLKVRLSYGTVGNDRISNRRFPYLTLVDEKGDGAGWGFSGGSIKEHQIGADNLIWEVAKKADLGFEARLLDDKINLVVDIFDDKRAGIFQERTQIPGFIGLTQMPFGNVGQMRSYGSDGNIAFTQKINKDLSVVLRGNFTYVKSDVLNWEESFPKYDYQYKTGMPYNVYRGYIAEGLFENEDDIAFSAKQSFGDSGPLPGDIKYRDVNGDGVIDTDDKVPLSYSNFPRLMYGFGTEVSYKKFSVGILFKGTGNTDYYHVDNDRGMGFVPFHGGKTGNVLTIVSDQANRWTPASYSNNPETENPNARFPRLSYGKNENNSQPSTFWHGNSRYLRLEEANINYMLQSAWIKKLGLKSIDLQLVGSNLLVFDKVKLWDPEQADSNGSQYPIPARFALQVYLNF